MTSTQSSYDIYAISISMCIQVDSFITSAPTKSLNRLPTKTLNGTSDGKFLRHTYFDLLTKLILARVDFVISANTTCIWTSGGAFVAEGFQFLELEPRKASSNFLAGTEKSWTVRLCQMLNVEYWNWK